MKRWNDRDKEMKENQKIDSFLNEIVNICKKYDFSLAHEDTHGSFEVESYSENNINWLLDAHDMTD